MDTNVRLSEAQTIEFKHRGKKAAVYVPWTNGYAIGFKVIRHGRATEFIYLNPSSEDDSGKPNVFVYQGVTGNPGHDTPQHHYTVE